MERIIEKETNTTTKSKEVYTSFDGLRFEDADSCKKYEDSVKAVSCQKILAQGKKISEFDLYNQYAGCEEYDYLILNVNKQNMDLLETLYKLYNVEVSEASPLPILGEKYVFGLGFCSYEDLIFEDFVPYGKAEDFYNDLTEKMKEIIIYHLSKE
jgi:hypothetical protein